MDRKNFLKTIAIAPFIHLAAGCPEKAAAATGEKCKTGRDAEGPFYKANAPARALIETEGTPLRIEGRVLKSDCQSPIANATLDIWHCDHHGDYDNKGFKCRGKVTTDAGGNYSFTTIFPPPYNRRPRHIHFKISAAGCQELTTQLYFEGDPNINNDFARNAEKGRVIALAEGKGFKTGVFDIFL